MANSYNFIKKMTMPFYEPFVNRPIYGGLFLMKSVFKNQGDFRKDHLEQVIIEQKT